MRFIGGAHGQCVVVDTLLIRRDQVSSVYYVRRQTRNRPQPGFTKAARIWNRFVSGAREPFTHVSCVSRKPSFPLVPALLIKGIGHSRLPSLPGRWWSRTRLHNLDTALEAVASNRVQRLHAISPLHSLSEDYAGVFCQLLQRNIYATPGVFFPIVLISKPCEPLQ